MNSVVFLIGFLMIGRLLNVSLDYHAHLMVSIVLRLFLLNLGLLSLAIPLFSFEKSLHQEFKHGPHAFV